MSCDNFFSNTVLLWHMDGLNGGTTFVDSSGYAHTTQSGFGAQTDTTHIQFGTAAYTGGAGGGFVRVPFHDPLSSELQIAAGQDFTVEASFWKNPADGNATNNCLFSLSRAPFVYAELYVEVTTGKLAAKFSDNAGTLLVLMKSAATICNSAWRQCAVARVGNVYSLYLDGTRVDTATNAGVVGSDATQCTTGMSLPGEGNADAARDCWVDEFRYTQGLARMTGASYTPEVEAFGDSQCAAPSADASVYGKFVDGSNAFAPIQSANLGNAKPRVFQPFDNETIKVPQ